MEKRKYGLFIGGDWVEAESGETFVSAFPATGEVVAELAKAGEADVDRAVKAARTAFEDGKWPKLSATERGRLLRKVAQGIQDRLEEFARLETLDTGKPIRDSLRIDIPMVVDVFDYYGGLADKIMGETIPVPGNFLDFTLREPVGVAGLIVPWNYPLFLASWKIAPALAAGCTVVVKPASLTPQTVLELANVMNEVGVPPGVYNVITGPGSEVGAALVEHPGVDKVALTGETQTGKLVMEMASKGVKSISLELGGKSPNIVFEDASMDEAVRGALFGIFMNQGEVCCAGSRLLLQESIKEEFLGKLVEMARGIRLGHPLERETQFGPLVSQEQLEKVEGYVESGLEEGAQLLTGGKRPQGEAFSKGFYYEPTVFSEVKPHMKIAQEEIFGPVLSVITFKDEKEAISIANDTIYGLAAGIWTRDVKRAFRVAKAIKAGNIWINTYNMLPPQAPFGGYKMSGIGRELGIHVISLYTEVKNIMVYLGKGGVKWFG